MKLEFIRARTEQHRDLLYQWANDPVTRMNAFNTGFIDYEDHCRWFTSKMGDASSVIYICANSETETGENVPIGQIRVDFKDSVGEIDFSVAPPFRGRGFGTAMLEQVPLQLMQDGIAFSVLTGKVKVSNMASQKAFVRAGYQIITSQSDQWLEFRRSAACRQQK